MTGFTTAVPVGVRRRAAGLGITLRLTAPGSPVAALLRATGSTPRSSFTLQDVRAEPVA
ncbi:hypothetical protein [Spirillospora sp. NPDC029432]|uniref:hypothetical protein n=1 Tax=Spirillospora sp. NPDC029432 TaxID=3154599 RepID=UPI003454C8B8